jgi:hypothetical protein
MPVHLGPPAEIMGALNKLIGLIKFAGLLLVRK